MKHFPAVVGLNSQVAQIPFAAFADIIGMCSNFTSDSFDCFGKCTLINLFC